jgi:hypothetical protein
MEVGSNVHGCVSSSTEYISTYAMIHSGLIKKLQEQDALIKTKTTSTKTKHSGC